MSAARAGINGQVSVIKTYVRRLRGLIGGRGGDDRSDALHGAPASPDGDGRQARQARQAYLPAGEDEFLLEEDWERPAPGRRKSLPEKTEDE